MKLPLFAWLLLTAVGCASIKKNQSTEEWQSLFNGKNLDGWDVKIRGYDLNDNFGNTFRVEDGKIIVRYDQYDEFKARYGHLFYKGDFSYYKISMEYRFVGEQAPKGEAWALKNSGVMIHTQPAITMGKDQDFPISLEVQFLGGDDKGTKRPTCNLCTPGTNVVINDQLVTTHCINSTSETYPGDQWVKAEAIVLGDSLIQHMVNGDKVLEYNKPQLGGGNVSGFPAGYIVAGKPLDHGSIALQSESHPVEFKNIILLNLKGCMDPKAKNFKTYYVKNDQESCEYAGKKK